MSNPPPLLRPRAFSEPVHSHPKLSITPESSSPPSSGKSNPSSPKALAPSSSIGAKVKQVADVADVRIRISNNQLIAEHAGKEYSVTILSNGTNVTAAMITQEQHIAVELAEKVCAFLKKENAFGEITEIDYSNDGKLTAVHNSGGRTTRESILSRNGGKECVETLDKIIPSTTFNKINTVAKRLTINSIYKIKLINNNGGGNCCFHSVIDALKDKYQWKNAPSDFHLNLRKKTAEKIQSEEFRESEECVKALIYDLIELRSIDRTNNTKTKVVTDEISKLLDKTEKNIKLEDDEINQLQTFYGVYLKENGMWADKAAVAAMNLLDKDELMQLGFPHTIYNNNGLNICVLGPFSIGKGIHAQEKLFSVKQSGDNPHENAVYIWYTTPGHYEGVKASETSIIITTHIDNLYTALINAFEEASKKSEHRERQNTVQHLLEELFEISDECRENFYDMLTKANLPINLDVIKDLEENEEESLATALTKDQALCPTIAAILPQQQAALFKNKHSFVSTSSASGDQHDDEDPSPIDPAASSPTTAKEDQLAFASSSQKIIPDEFLRKLLTSDKWKSSDKYTQDVLVLILDQTIKSNLIPNKLLSLAKSSLVYLKSDSADLNKIDEIQKNIFTLLNSLNPSQRASLSTALKPFKTP